MTDIPEDIFLAAQAEIAKGDMAFMTVARAILAERERCAQVAENSAVQTVGDRRRADAIASAIRSPERAGE